MNGMSHLPIYSIEADIQCIQKLNGQPVLESVSLTATVLLLLLALLAAVAALAVAAATFWVLATKEFKTIASPVICVLCSDDTLISRFRMVPLAVDPRRTAAGWG